MEEEEEKGRTKVEENKKEDEVGGRGIRRTKRWKGKTGGGEGKKVEEEGEET